MVALHGGLEVVELALGGEVAVVAEHGAHGQSHLVGLGEVEAATAVGDGGTFGGHDVDKLEGVGLVDGGPVDGVLVLGHEDAQGCRGLSCGDEGHGHEEGEQGGVAP